MRSHRLALAGLALAFAVGAAGCGSGKDTDAFLSPGADEAAVAPAPSAPAPPVVIAGPDDEVLAERDRAKAQAAAKAAAAERAEKKRRAARRELREERAKAKRARKRAAAREARLRVALSGATAEPKPAVAPATPRPATPAPISGSSVDGPSLTAERDRRSAAEARAAVVRFHEMLNNRDVRACDLLTAELIARLYGTEDDAAERCRAAVQSIDAPVSVVIAESRARGRTASVAAVSRVGDSEVEQTFSLVLVNGTWLLDTTQRTAGR